MSAFRNILLPVDFTSNTHIAIKRAIDLAEPDESVIHLLHISKANAKEATADSRDWARLKDFKRFLENSIRGVKILIEIYKCDSIEKGIVQKAMEKKPELIIIARNKGRRFLVLTKRISPARIAKLSHVPVLTIKPGSDDRKIRSIVVPFRSVIPKDKLNVLVPLVWKRKTTVFLVAMQNELKDFELGDTSVSHTLIETYRLLKEDVNCQIVHKLISGSNFAKSMLRFAESVGADVLLVNPDEIRVSALGKLDISDMLEKNSKMQLLTIAQEAQVVL
ncbi:MAG: universal stress protein [Bacteroidetes bacterium]|nr:universal stress protein [Bacteroidota bacterium]